MNSQKLYPEVILSNPEDDSSGSPASSNFYPSLDAKELAANLSPDLEDTVSTEQPSCEETIISIPGVIVHLIEENQSVELACGELNVVSLSSLKQGETIVAVLARVGDEIQWPLAKDEAAVKHDESHYLFSLRVPGNGDGKETGLLNYGVALAAKGQERLLREFDEVLENYSAFSVKEVRGMEWNLAKEISPQEIEEEEKKEMMEQNSAAYWTFLAPNVEDYSGSVARMIAAGSGQLIKGILWCREITVDRLKWGDEFLRKRIKPGSRAHISPATMRRIKRVKKLTKMTEKVATGILSGVLKVSGFLTSSIVNSSVGKKLFSLLLEEIVLASLEGFNKVCDAVEVTGKNVMSTSSTVTTGIVSQRYGEQAGSATNEGLDTAGHAIGTAWAIFKIRKALNPKSSVKPSARASAADKKAKSKK